MDDNVLSNNKIQDNIINDTITIIKSDPVSKGKEYADFILCERIRPCFNKGSGCPRNG